MRLGAKANTVTPTTARAPTTFQLVHVFMTTSVLLFLPRQALLGYLVHGARTSGPLVLGGPPHHLVHPRHARIAAHHQLVHAPHARTLHGRPILPSSVVSGKGAGNGGIADRGECRDGDNGCC